MALKLTNGEKDRVRSFLEAAHPLRALGWSYEDIAAVLIAEDARQRLEALASDEKSWCGVPLHEFINDDSRDAYPNMQNLAHSLACRGLFS